MDQRRMSLIEQAVYRKQHTHVPIRFGTSLHRKYHISHILRIYNHNTKEQYISMLKQNRTLQNTSGLQ